MLGTPDNTHPNALAAAPIEQVAGRMVKVVRELKPQVVLTFDPIGGYRHPDHVAVHNAAVQAFEVAGDPAKYQEAGPPHRPQKLYFPVFSHRALRMMVRLMPLFGRDPKHSGRNKDIDLTAIAGIDFPVHAAIRLTKVAMAARDRASECHASQLGGRPPPGGLLRLFDTFSGTRDYFMRAYPPPGRRRETDLFAGVR
jgi:N-acetyl-1-D-myo-inositol-2-amino-2-deoxy-alpha-D-glucopyranoside deacetylase/mycothiol S-conjugate amidase